MVTMLPLPPFLEKIRRLGFPVVEAPHRVNWIAVRMSNHAPGYYTDWMTAWTLDQHSEWRSYWWRCTTQVSPIMARRGHHSVVPGHYPDLWTLAHFDNRFGVGHVGFQAVHDGPSGTVADRNPNNSDHADETTDLVGEWGDGSIVWATSRGFRRARRLAAIHQGKWDEAISLTLVDHTDVDGIHLP